MHLANLDNIILFDYSKISFNLHIAAKILQELEYTQHYTLKELSQKGILTEELLEDKDVVCFFNNQEVIFSGAIIVNHYLNSFPELRQKKQFSDEVDQFKLNNYFRIDSKEQNDDRLLEVITQLESSAKIKLNDNWFLPLDQLPLVLRVISGSIQGSTILNLINTHLKTEAAADSNTIHFQSANFPASNVDVTAVRIHDLQLKNKNKKEQISLLYLDKKLYVSKSKAKNITAQLVRLDLGINISNRTYYSRIVQQLQEYKTSSETIYYLLADLIAAAENYKQLRKSPRSRMDESERIADEDLSGKIITALPKKKLEITAEAKMILEQLLSTADNFRFDKTIEDHVKNNSEEESSNKLVLSNKASTTEEKEKVKKHIYLVKIIATEMIQKYSFSVQLDDLINYGVIGLIDAVKKYNVLKSDNPKNYYDRRIRGAIGDGLREMDYVSRNTRKKIKRYEKAEKELIKENREVTDEALAEKLDMKLSKFHKLKSEVNNTKTCYIADLLMRCDGEDFGYDEDKLSAINSNNQLVDYESSIEKTEQLTYIAAAIASLENRKQKKAVLSYFTQDIKLNVIAEALDVTESRVSQLLKEALYNIKQKVNRYMMSYVL